MYEKARDLDVPFMAGSSLVNCYRNPYLEHDLEAPIEEAIAVGFSGLDICTYSGELHNLSQLDNKRRCSCYLHTWVSN